MCVKKLFEPKRGEATGSCAEGFAAGSAARPCCPWLSRTARLVF